MRQAFESVLAGSMLQTSFSSVYTSHEGPLPVSFMARNETNDSQVKQTQL